MIGDKIKRIRNMRGMTQKALGLAVGFSPNTADVRIDQYEAGKRTPKAETLNKISEVLNVNPLAISEPTLYSLEDLMFILFELDEHYSISIHDVEDGGVAINFNRAGLKEFLKEWQTRKQELEIERENAGTGITKEEYNEWKLNFPRTADGCGKVKPDVDWRNKED